jgi:hypothetical protein
LIDDRVMMLGYPYMSPRQRPERLFPPRAPSLVLLHAVRPSRRDPVPEPFSSSCPLRHHPSLPPSLSHAPASRPFVVGGGIRCRLRERTGTNKRRPVGTIVSNFSKAVSPRTKRNRLSFSRLPQSTCNNTIAERRSKVGHDTPFMHHTYTHRQKSVTSV